MSVLSDVTRVVLLKLAESLVFSLIEPSVNASSIAEMFYSRGEFSGS